MNKKDKFILNIKPILLGTFTSFFGVLSIFGLVLPFLPSNFLDEIPMFLKAIILGAFLLLTFIILTILYMFILKKKL